MTHRYSWKPDVRDPRDWQLENIKPPLSLPSAVDLTSRMPPVFDQGQLGSCTANAAAAALAFEHGGGPYSRLFIYYNERFIEGDVADDDGAQNRTAVRALKEYGAPLESSEPYTPDRFAQKPSAADYKAAEATKVTEYRSVIGLEAMLTCLADGYPFLVGFTVYEAFESENVARDGIVPMPEGEPIGGHCVCATGYEERMDVLYFRCRNSWGRDWGLAGDFLIPADYLTNVDYASSFWTIRK